METQRDPFPVSLKLTVTKKELLILPPLGLE